MARKKSKSTKKKNRAKTAEIRRAFNFPLATLIYQAKRLKNALNDAEFGPPMRLEDKI